MTTGIFIAVDGPSIVMRDNQIFDGHGRKIYIQAPTYGRVLFTQNVAFDVRGARGCIIQNCIIEAQ